MKKRYLFDIIIVICLASAFMSLDYDVNAIKLAITSAIAGMWLGFKVK